MTRHSPSPHLRLASFVAALLLLAAAPAARAQESARTLDHPDTSYAAGVPDPAPVGLTLDQARRLAADHSPAAHAARGNLRIARGARMKEAGAFDPVLFGDGQRVSADAPVSSPFAASETRVRSLSGGATWTSPIGTDLRLAVSQVRTETNSAFTTLPRERRARARLDFVQPLLKGFGPDATRGELRAADRLFEAARRDLEAADLDVTAGVENAYWVLYAAERDLDVQRVQRQRAAVFLRREVLRGRAGAVGPGAVAIARTFLAEQEASLLATQVRLGAASDLLAEAVGVAPRPGERYRALDTPPPPPAPEPLEIVLDRALATNPGLLAAGQEALAARARARAAAWNAWPALDAFGGYGGTGLAGTGRQLVFGGDTTGANFDTGFGDAWRQVRGDDFPDWSFGLRVTMPIGWRADRGELERRRGERERAEAALTARRLTLESEVRQAHREAELSGRALEAMRTLVEAAEEQARIARLEYQAGRATAYDLVNLEADLTQARFRESEVLVRVARAASELRRLTTPASGRKKP